MRSLGYLVIVVTAACSDPPKTAIDASVGVVEMSSYALWCEVEENLGRNIEGQQVRFTATTSDCADSLVYAKPTGTSTIGSNNHPCESSLRLHFACAPGMEAAGTEFRAVCSTFQRNKMCVVEASGCELEGFTPAVPVEEKRTRNRKPTK